MKNLILFVLLSSLAFGQAYVKTPSGRYVKLNNQTIVGDSITITASASVDSSIYASKTFVANQYAARSGTTIGSKPNAHIGDDGFVYKSTDTASAGYAWTRLDRTSDTTSGSFTFVNLGQLQFTMEASSTYEVFGMIYYVRATAANGVTLALNTGGTPTNVGMRFEALDNTTDGTDQVKTARITTGTDSLQLLNTGVTTRDFIYIQGTLTCDASNRLFTLRFRCEVAASNITISRGSWIEYRKLY